MATFRTKYIQDEGIVLKATDCGEADKTLTIFTKDFGKLEVLAKNVRKLNSRRAAACNLLSLSKFTISQSRFDTIAETFNLTQFSKIKSSLSKLSLAFCAIEVLNLIIPLATTYSDVFNLFSVFLQNLAKSESLREGKVALTTFQVELLIKTGWLGKDFDISKFGNFNHLERFLQTKFEEISQKRLKSAEFAKIVLEV